jgi:hypothetical protein
VSTPPGSPPPAERECDPVGHCRLIGTLDGLPDSDGVVAVREDEGLIPTPTTHADLQPPLALRLSTGGPIELLGAVTGGSADLRWPVAQLLTKSDARRGEVFTVDGWLVGVPGFSCGPAPMPATPPVPIPFSCHIYDFLTPVSEQPVSGDSTSRSARPPTDGIAVQRGAYDQFADDPTFEGVVTAPRHGVYLVRWITYDAVNCEGCRGWEVVGRVAPLASSAPSTPPSDAVPSAMSAAQYAAEAAANRAPLLGRIVFIDGNVTRTSGGDCPSAAECPIGMLDGTRETVSADAFTVSMLRNDPILGRMSYVMAFRVRQADLQYLGYLGYSIDNTFLFKVAALADPATMNHAPLMVAVTTGWLVDESPSYPIPYPQSTPPADTPFDLPRAYLSAESFQPTTKLPNGYAYATPSVGIAVQRSAYWDFAPDPGADPSGVGDAPRSGTWLVRLVQDLRQANYTSGWQLLARLAP